MGVLRAYEDGKPAKPANFLKINFAGPAAGEPVFVSGHPGATDRAADAGAAQAAAQPRAAAVAAAVLGDPRPATSSSRSTSPQNERITRRPRSTASRTRIKVRRKMLDALHDDALLARKAAEEATLREERREGRHAQEEHRRSVERHRRGAGRRARRCSCRTTTSENGAGFQGRLVHYARTLVRGAAERDKPNGQRFREYTDGALPRVEQQLGAAVPVYPSSRSCASATASSACASGWAPITPWCASCCRRNRRRRSPSASSTGTQARRSGGAHGAVERRLGRHRRVDRSR